MSMDGKLIVVRLGEDEFEIKADEANGDVGLMAVLGAKVLEFLKVAPEGEAVEVIAFMQ